MVSGMDRPPTSADQLSSRSLRGRGAHDVPAAAVIVIDAEDFERSQKDPRVHDLFDRGRALHADLEARASHPK